MLRKIAHSDWRANGGALLGAARHRSEARGNALAVCKYNERQVVDGLVICARLECNNFARCADTDKRRTSSQIAATMNMPANDAKYRRIARCLTCELTRPRRLAKPAIALPVQRR